MSEIVRRLRAEGQAFRGTPDCVGPDVTLLVEEAADTITRLEGEVERLQVAISWIAPPFVTDSTPVAAAARDIAEDIRALIPSEADPGATLNSGS